MKKTILEIYALAICLIVVIWSVISINSVLHSLFGIVKPEFTMSKREFDRYQTNDAYALFYREKEAPRLPEAELTKKREEAYPIAIKSEQRESYKNLNKELITLLLNGFLFLIHWRLARKARALE